MIKSLVYWFFCPTVYF